MAQKKKRPKVILKKNQVIILASTIVAVCACMLTVTILTSPKTAIKDEPPVSSEGSPAVSENPHSNNISHHMRWKHTEPRFRSF